MDSTSTSTSQYQCGQSKCHSTLLSRGLFLNNLQQVEWAPGNERHPRNWSTLRKAFDTSVIIFLDFFTSAAPVASAASFEYNLRDSSATFLFVSVYLIGQGIGSLTFPPYSEVFGRKKLYVGSAILYATFAFVVAAVTSLPITVIGRFVTGLLSGVPSAVVAGSIEDMYNEDERIWLIFTWALTANFGIIIGPIGGIYITHSFGWRKLFFIAAAVVAIVAGLLFFIRESRPTKLLDFEVHKVREELGDDSLMASNPDRAPDLQTFLQNGLWRPLRLLFTEPLILVLSIMGATAFALFYLFTEALQVVFVGIGLDERQATLPFLAAGVGVMASSITRLRDRRHFAKLRLENRIPTPEDKLFGFAVGAPALAVGLWWFAWTIPPGVQTHWSVPTIALVFIGFAINELDTVLGGYLVDSYTLYASSAWASATFVRTGLSAAFPVFARKMFVNVGPNVASSILAAVATVFCITPILFSKYGRAIRQRSKYAS